MKNLLFLLIITLLASCTGAGTMTQNIGGKTLSFHRQVYALGTATAVVELRRTKTMVLYDSLVTDNQTSKKLFYREQTRYDNGAVTVTDFYYSPDGKKVIAANE